MSSYNALYQNPFHMEKAYFKTGCHARNFPQSIVTAVLTSFSKSPLEAIKYKSNRIKT